MTDAKPYTDTLEVDRLRQFDAVATECIADHSRLHATVEALERAKEALREIARGKSRDDVGCLADEWLLMAGRLVRIARAALEEGE